MKNLWRLLLIPLMLIGGHVFAPGSAAHPLGNFTINHYHDLQISREAIVVVSVIDMAEIPAFQEIALIDSNGNTVADAAEAAAYHPAQCTTLAADLELRVDNRPLPLTLATSSVTFPPSVGGLPTLRLNCAFQAPLRPREGYTAVAFSNNAYAKRPGWREIIVTTGEFAIEGEVATRSISEGLTRYPDDLLIKPLNQRTVSFQLAAGSPGQSADQPLIQLAPEQNDARGDAFTNLITMQELTPITVLLALLIAFVWGAAHALSPGHGKTVVAAYLVGSRGTVQHALFLGLTTTITHTAGVFALGMITLFAARFIVPEQLFPWLSLGSGLLVVGIGINLFLDRLRSARHSAHHHRGHDDDHSHDHHHHDHDHGHDHHHHGPGGHSHVPPGADDRPVTWQALLALGVSGGLLPCPSALVVLLSAIALGRVGFGLVLVLAFSLGLAGLLTATGIAFIYAGRFFERIALPGRLFRLLPAASALVIALVGVGISAQAFVEIGLIG
jgi:ABC-type nickel/cobalt efflux system permease component RcnA